MSDNPTVELVNSCCTAFGLAAGSASSFVMSNATSLPLVAVRPCVELLLLAVELDESAASLTSTAPLLTWLVSSLSPID